MKEPGVGWTINTVGRREIFRLKPFIHKHFSGLLHL